MPEYELGGIMIIRIAAVISIIAFCAVLFTGCGGGSSVAPAVATIKVISPNGGETPHAGENLMIAWVSQDVTGTVEITYSKDNFAADIQVIVAGWAGSGSYSWQNIPDDQSTTVRVRVSSTSDPTVFDISDADFSILAPIVVQVGWAVSFGSGKELGKDVAVDPDGNFYIVGTFDPGIGGCDFDPGPGDAMIDTNGWEDIYISKFDTDGNFLWVQTWGGTGTDEGHAVAVDPAGSVYVSGKFESTVDFDPGTGTHNKTASGTEDVFLSKFDLDGNFLWAETWGSGDTASYPYSPFYGDCGESVAVDASGDVYVACNQRIPGIRKYSSAGMLVFTYGWGTSSTFDRAYGVAVSSDAVYIAGRFTGTMDFDPGLPVDNHTANDYVDSCLIKLDLSGSYQWGLNWGGTDKLTGYANPPYYGDCAFDVAVDSSGNPYVCGSFYGTTDFDPGAGTTAHTAVDDFGDAYLVRFTATGVYQWVEIIAGDHFQESFGISINASGDLGMTGRFYNTVDFDTGGGTEDHTSVGDSDIFLSKYDVNGNWKWTLTWGSTSYDLGVGTAFDPLGNVLMAGYFNDTIDFDPGADTDDHTAGGFDDAVLIKLNPDGFWD